MEDDDYPIELMVQTHPSGRLTLVAKQGPGVFRQLDGELCGNADAAAFYRAVAAYMGRLSYAGLRLVYHESETSGPSLPR